MFKGTIDAPVGGYILASRSGLRIPLIVEPANIMVNASANGALIQGGEQQWLFAQYNQIGQEFATVQAKILVESRQPGADVDALQTQVNQAYQASLNQTNELIMANRDAYATAYIIALGARNETEESLRAKYELLGEAAKESVPGRQIAFCLEQFAKLAEGEKAPDFTLPRLNGEVFTLYTVPAKIKLVVFWASWDAASRQFNTELIQLDQQFHSRNFEIVSVSLDNNRWEWEAASGQDGLIWPNGSDLQGVDSPVAKAYMVGNTLPYTVLIDDENKIVAKGLLGKELRAAVSDLTKKNRK